MDTFASLTNYYESYDEDARLGYRHGQPEFRTTVHYVERYLRPGMRILEIGAGTGRYSHYFARAGYRVDAVELIAHNIEIFCRNTLPGENVTVAEGNALDLAGFADDTYDITLLLGPMYHLYTRKEQKRALSEAIRVTKPGGVIFAAYCNNDMTVYQFCFGKGMMDGILARQMIDPVTFETKSTPAEIFQLYRRENIDALMEGFDVTRLHYVGTDMLTRFLTETVDAMTDEQFAVYMRYHLSICERADMTGLSNHMLDVFRKNG